jgi:hypothetical protein
MNTLTKYAVVFVLALFVSVSFGKESANFSGDWVLDKELSQMPESSIQICKIDIKQDGNKLATSRTYENDYGEEYPFSEDITLGGDPLEHFIYDMPRKAEAKWAKDKKNIVFESTTTFYGDSGEVNMLAKENWKLDNKAGTFTIEFTSSSSMGEQKGTAVFKKTGKKVE